MIAIWLQARGSCLVGIVCGLLACACKDTKPAPTPAPAGSGAPADAKITVEHHEIPIDAPPAPEGDWAICKAGLEKAATAPATKRVDVLLEACHPCGDWKPILEWQTLQEDGGPNRKVIQIAMEQCKAWCNVNAKIRFMGALDDARMKKSRTPWRELATQCGDAVSAVPDGRFVTAPYFAVDRIARWVATQDGGPALLDKIDLPLPVVSQTGVGLELPDAPLMKPEITPVQLTVTPAGFTIGAMPRAKLSDKGVVPQGEPYPGKLLAGKELAAAQKKLGGKTAIFAHPGLPAATLAEAVRWAATGPVVLAATSTAGPVGWKQHGIVPVLLATGAPAAGSEVIALGATADAAVAKIKALGPDAVKAKGVAIQLEEGATVGSVATLLGAVAFYELERVTLIPPPKPPAKKK